MPSSSSSSSRSAARPRSASVPSRHFVFVVTNHPDFRQLRSSTTTRIHREAPLIRTTLSTDREQLLRNLLRVEMRQAAHHYLSRTHQSASSIEYIFLISDVEPEE